MPAPLQLSDECRALWEDACARWQAGEVTADELAERLGVSRRTVYYRLQDAQQRLETQVLDANQAAYEARRAERIQAIAARALETESREPGPPEIDEGAYLVLTDDPLREIRRIRDYSQDRFHGEERYIQRDHYNINTDCTSRDDVGGAVLLGNGAIRYDGSGAGRLRVPVPPLAGQRLQRTRIGAEKKSLEEDAEPESEGRAVNDTDKAKGVAFVQKGKKPVALKGGIG